MCAKDCPDPNDPPEGFYAALVARHSSDGVVISGPDRKARWVNTAFTAQTGYGPADILGKEPGSLLQGADTDRDAARCIALACAQRREVRLDILNYTRDGTPFWVDLKVTPVYDTDGLHTHFISTMRDISERKTLEDQNEEMRQAESLRQSERQLLALTSEWLYSAKSFEELLMVVRRAMHTLIPEADGALYIYATQRNTLDLVASWGTIPDFPGHILPDDCWALRRGRAYAFGLKPIQFPCDHVHQKDTPYFCLPIIAHGETIGLMHIIFDGFEEGGLMRHMRAEVLNNRWDVSLICAEQISLAVANVRLRQELHERSMRDALTGLWNRRWFTEQAARELANAERENTPLSLVAVDVDHFKRFNDRFGHDAGDLVLREVAGLMQAIGPDTVFPCRLGGEEFTLLCVGMPRACAVDQAEELRTRVAALQLSSGGSSLPCVNISCGVASYPQDGKSLAQLMKLADTALYAAKEGGRNRTISVADLSVS
ncbi:diguanylate cyclase [Roseibaca sp. V10]|uniref:Diguanylate cyclase n=1 Tax=Roseinatronobacter domitianus TaxID=2940293 RepID=A0ABT0M449_9RHOB|nr:diguanylate cyclase [Roseibaca domitiana]MCL1629630.1 diguanylate cyclase [Roseibaca domitiana]